MSLPMKQMKVLLLKLEKQGCTVKPTKAGYLILMPNGDTVTFHRTPSDHRATKNMRARILRAGLEWPFDSKN
jgi:hypothetical protein